MFYPPDLILLLRFPLPRFLLRFRHSAWVQVSSDQLHLRFHHSAPAQFSSAPLSPPVSFPCSSTGSRCPAFSSVFVPLLQHWFPLPGFPLRFHPPASARVSAAPLSPPVSSPGLGAGFLCSAFSSSLVTLLRYGSRCPAFSSVFVPLLQHWFPLSGFLLCFRSPAPALVSAARLSPPVSSPCFGAGFRRPAFSSGFVILLGR